MVKAAVVFSGGKWAVAEMDRNRLATWKREILTFKRRIKSHLPFAGIIRSSPYSPRFQDNG